MTSSTKDTALKDYGSGINVSAVDEWEERSERGRTATRHYGDPTDNLLIELKAEIRELGNRMSILESKVNRLLESKERDH